MKYADIVRFHGHDCPGLAIGYRMAAAGLNELRAMRAEDEEIVAIVENDACGVDALQCLSGCTFGKGNLLLKDYGKQVYTLYTRSRRSGVRVVFHGKGIPDSIREDKQALSKWILQASLDSIISAAAVTIDEPEPARILESTTCAYCGEMVMQSRLRIVDDKPACIPCEKQLIRFENKDLGERA